MNTVVHFVFVFTTFALAGITIATSPYHNSNCAENRVAIVHLFEWKWTNIARECEDFLGPRGFCGVQVSPPNEHVLVTTDANRPWWERYQPVSYKLTSRSGSREEFVDMVRRCNAANVRIYVDLVINHMAGLGRSGQGSAGSTFNSDVFDFPGVPFSQSHFNSREKCGSGSGTIQNYGDAYQVRNCMLVGLTDLDQSQAYVRDKLVGYLNDIINIGVAGFRIDAAKHMWPSDLEAILSETSNLNTEFFPANQRPFVFLEVIDMSNEPIKGQDYSHLGRVTEFRYCIKIREKIGSVQDLGSVYDAGWGMLPSDDAFVFVDNHDNQRGHGASAQVISHKDPKQHKMAVAFTLAYNYGFPRVMSSYEFEGDSDGPPHNGDYSTKDVIINSDGSCGNGWICEHRWRPIAAMAGFRKAVSGTGVDKWWSGNNALAFARGNKGFFAISGGSTLDVALDTGLPAGQYCNVITGYPTNEGCQGDTVTVDGSGSAGVLITNTEEPMFAIHVEAMAGSGSVKPTGQPPKPQTTISTGGQNPQPTTSSGQSGDYQRTVIFIKKVTQNGQDLFIRGGISHSRRPECSSDRGACSVSIASNDIGQTSHYDKYNSWRSGDRYLDWDGGEANQGSYNGQSAEGTAAAWTSNSATSPGFQDLNSYGDHYWVVDVNMDCSQTEQGWFEFKSFLSNYGWERDVTQSNSCQGNVGGAKPYSSNNHFARCGYVNVFEFDSGSCTITNFS